MTNMLALPISQDEDLPRSALNWMRFLASIPAAEFAGLSKPQRQVLSRHYSQGLRLSHLQSWQPNPAEPQFGLGHVSLLARCFKELNLSPEEAMLRINGKTNAEAAAESCELIREHSLRAPG